MRSIKGSRVRVLCYSPEGTEFFKSYPSMLEGSHFFRYYNRRFFVQAKNCNYYIWRLFVFYRLFSMDWDERVIVYCGLVSVVGGNGRGLF